MGSLIWAFGFIVVFGALFMVVTVIRNKFMGPEAPEHFNSGSSGGHDCSACDVADCESRKA